MHTHLFIPYIFNEFILIHTRGKVSSVPCDNQSSCYPLDRFHLLTRTVSIHASIFNATGRRIIALNALFTQLPHLTDAYINAKDWEPNGGKYDRYATKEALVYNDWAHMFLPKAAVVVVIKITVSGPTKEWAKTTCHAAP